MPKNVTQAVTRPVRTAMQATPSFIITEFLDAWLYDMSDRQYGALVVLLTLVFGWAQVVIENRKGKGILRRVPPKTDPVPGA